MIAIKATTKENSNKNNVVFKDKNFIMSVSVVGNSFPVLNDFRAMAIIKGT